MGDSEAAKVFYPGENFWSVEEDGLHLIGSHCKTCGQNYFPPREICPACFPNGVESETEPISLSNIGELYSFSIVHVAPKMFITPYGLGYVDFSGRGQGARAIHHGRSRRNKSWHAGCKRSLE